MSGHGMSGVLAVLGALAMLAGSATGAQAAGGGMRGGITQSHFTEHLGQRLDEPRDGFSVGFYSIRPMSNSLGVETGLSYTTKGGTANRASSINEPNGSLDMSTVVVSEPPVISTTAACDGLM